MHRHWGTLSFTVGTVRAVVNRPFPLLEFALLPPFLPLFFPCWSASFCCLYELEVKTSLFCPFLFLPVAGLMHFGRGEILSQEFGAGAGVFVLLPLAAGLGLSVPLPTLAAGAGLLVPLPPAAGPGLWVRGDDWPQAPADGLPC